MWKACTTEIDLHHECAHVGLSIYTRTRNFGSTNCLQTAYLWGDVLGGAAEGEGAPSRLIRNTEVAELHLDDQTCAHQYSQVNLSLAWLNIAAPSIAIREFRIIGRKSAYMPLQCQQHILGLQVTVDNLFPV